MKTATQKYFAIGALVIALVSALYSLGWILFFTSGAATDEVLVKKISQEVVKELKENGQLQNEIDEGIIRFVSKRNEGNSTGSLVKNIRPVSTKRDHILGNPNAPVTLIEYSDFECPFCKRFHPTAHKVIKAFNGKVNWVYRHFPISSHNPAALLEALASECAAELGGNDSFWKLTDLIYEKTLSNGNGIPAPGLYVLVKEVGLEENEFQECMQSGRHTARVQEDYENGTRSGVRGTPGNFLLNNKTGDIVAAHGAVPYEKLKEVLENMLKY